MSGGSSKSSSKSSTVTTTEQQDERVTATDFAIAIGADANLSGATLQQVTPEIAAAFDRTIQLAEQGFKLAESAGLAAIEAKDGNTSNTRQYLLIGAVVLVVTIGLLRK